MQSIPSTKSQFHNLNYRFNGQTTVSSSWNAFQVNSSVSNGLVQGGGVLANPFSRRKTVNFSPESYVYHVQTRSYPSGPINDQLWFGQQNPSEISSAMPAVTLWDTDDRALNSLYKRLSDHPNLVVDAIESGQTASMIRNSTRVTHMFINMVETLRDIRRLRIDRASKRISSAWLELRYGWTPLLCSVYDTAKALGMKHADYIKYEGSASGLLDDYIVKYKSDNSGSFSGQTSVDKRMTKYRTKYGVSYTSSQSLVDSLQDFTSLNPLVIAWEVLPFSFVADWFIDIGGYLSSWESALRFSQKPFRTGYRTRTYLSEREYHRFGGTLGYPMLPSGISYTERFQSFTTSSRTTSLDRIRLNSLPIPNAFPQVNCRFGGKQFLDSLALTIQVFKDPVWLSRRSSGRF